MEKSICWRKFCGQTLQIEVVRFKLHCSVFSFSLSVDSLSIALSYTSSQLRHCLLHFISQHTCSQTQFTKSIRVCTVCMVLTSINRSYSQIPIWTTNHLYESKVLRNGSSWQCPLQTRLIVQTAEQTGWSSPLQKVGRKFAMIWYRRGAASCEILWLITIITPHHLSPRWISSLILTAIFLCEHSFHIFATPRTLTRSHHTAGEILQFALQTSASRALSSLGSLRSCFYIHKPHTLHSFTHYYYACHWGYQYFYKQHNFWHLPQRRRQLKCDLRVAIVRL